MPTVKEMMEHLFSSDEEEEGDIFEEHLSVRKKCRLKAANHSSTSHGSEDLANASNLLQTGIIRPPSPRRAPSTTIPVVQKNMLHPTKGAVVALTTGAISSNCDVSSVGSDEVSSSQSFESETAMRNAGNDSSTSYDSQGKANTSNLCQPEKRKRSPRKAPPPPIFLVQEDMDPTKGAVAALTTGALSSNGDINAIFDGGKVECLAGQLIMEDEVVCTNRCLMCWAEYYPILQVQRIVWHSNLSKENSMGVPRMVFFVTDGLDEMPMVASTRKYSLLASFWDKKGPYETGVLRHGKIFKLLDYHMGLKKDPASGKMVPCIFVEKVRAQPKRNMKKFRTIRAFVKEKIFK